MLGSFGRDRTRPKAQALARSGRAGIVFLIADIVYNIGIQSLPRHPVVERVFYSLTRSARIHQT